MKEIKVVNGMPMTPELKKKIWPTQGPEDFDEEGHCRVRPFLSVRDEESLWRDDLIISIDNDGMGTYLRIQFGPDEYSCLNAAEMKRLVHLIKNGTNLGNE